MRYLHYFLYEVCEIQYAFILLTLFNSDINLTRNSSSVLAFTKFMVEKVDSYTQAVSNLRKHFLIIKLSISLYIHLVKENIKFSSSRALAVF